MTCDALCTENKKSLQEVTASYIQVQIYHVPFQTMVRKSWCREGFSQSMVSKTSFHCIKPPITVCILWSPHILVIYCINVQIYSGNVIYSRSGTPSLAMMFVLPPGSTACQPFCFSLFPSATFLLSFLGLLPSCRIIIQTPPRCSPLDWLPGAHPCRLFISFKLAANSVANQLWGEKVALPFLEHLDPFCNEKGGINPIRSHFCM